MVIRGNMTYYTVKQTAQILGVSYTYMRQLIESGQIEASNIGRGSEKIWRISDVEIARYMKSKSNLNKEKI